MYLLYIFWLAINLFSVFKNPSLQKLKYTTRLTKAGEKVLEQGLGDSLKLLRSPAGRATLVKEHFPAGGPVAEPEDFESSESESD